MNYRAIIGFLVAAIIPPVALALLSPITGGDLIGVLGLIPLLLFFSGAATLLLGVPAFLLLNHFGLVRWWSAAISGIFIGAVVAVVIRAPNIVQLNDLLVMVPIGGLSALVFWMIWRPHHAA